MNVGNESVARSSCQTVKARAVVACQLNMDLENAGATFVDEAIVNDHKVITSRTPKDLTLFCHEIIAELSKSKDK